MFREDFTDSRSWRLHSKILKDVLLKFSKLDSLKLSGFEGLPIDNI